MGMECVIGTGIGKSGYMLVLTIYKNNIVRLLSVFKTTGRGTPTVYLKVKTHLQLYS